MALGFGGNDDPRQEDPQRQMVEELRKIREEINKMVRDVDRIKELVEHIRKEFK